MVFRRQILPIFCNFLSRTMAVRPAEDFSKVLKVRNSEKVDKLNVVFEDCWNCLHVLEREKNEQIGVVLKRIQLTILKAQRKRSRKGVSGPIGIPMEAYLYDPSGDLVPVDKTNAEAWVDDGRLMIGPHSYTVKVNPPGVRSLTLSETLLSGCPIVPKVELDNSEISLCKWMWFRKPTPVPSQEITSLTSSKLSTQVVVGTGYTYWPSEDDVGHQLMLECTPVSSTGKTGECLSCVSLGVVSQSPSNTPIHKRHLHTPWQLEDADKFRMVTYNALAGVFTEEEYAKTVLYPYCDPAALAITYRQCILMQELMGYNADIISLQEVTNSTFDKYLLPAFQDKGYDGILQLKAGTVNEGEAIIFNKSKFNLVDSDSVVLSEFKNDPSCRDLLLGILKAPFFQQVEKKSAIALVCLLQSVERPDCYVLVANTHLYYHPKGDLIRLIQVAILMRYLQTRLDSYVSTLGDSAKIATILAGDFNTCPCIAAYQYLTTGSVGKDHQDWMMYKEDKVKHCECYYKYNAKSDKVLKSGTNSDALPPYHFAREDQEDKATSSVDTFAGLDLQHSFNFHNVTGTSNLTNYTASFKAVLDYIFIDSDLLGVDRLIPLPPEEDLKEFVALPSVYFPSDHLALVADLKWK